MQPHEFGTVTLAYACKPTPIVSARMWATIVGALTAPFIMASAIIMAGETFKLRLPEWSPAWWPFDMDLVGFAAIFGGGLIFVGFLPLRWWLRLPIAVAYVPVLYHPLIIYALLFVGYVYGKWL